MTERKHKRSPAQEAYDAQHKIVSCRLSLEVYEALQKAMAADSKDLAEVIQIGIGRLTLHTQLTQAERENLMWSSWNDAIEHVKKTGNFDLMPITELREGKLVYKE